MVFSIEFIEKNLKIDDAIGAASAHGVAGAWGTLWLLDLWGVDGCILESVYLHSVDGISAFSQLRYSSYWCSCLRRMGGIVTSLIVLYVLKATIGLRVSEEDELKQV